MTAIEVLLVGSIAAVALWFFGTHLALWHVEATMHPAVVVQDRTVHVTGTTDLADGAVIGYYYVHVAPTLQGQEPDGGVTTVRNGRFDFQTDFTEWPGGLVTLYTEFAVGPGWDQPQAVIDRFGTYGDRISGPQAYSESGDPPTLLATATFEIAGESR